MDDPNRLSVMYDGQPIGYVEIVDRSPRKVVGRLVPSGAFAQNCQLIDEARGWAKRFDSSHDSDSLDYLAFDKYVELTKQLTSRIVIPELRTAIEEFAVDQNFGVEVTLGEAVE